jgi:NAD(P)-dependent dehydrogenase (short-subunit alcohol dehydrogenase family)
MLDETAELVRIQWPGCDVVCISGDVTDAVFRSRLVAEVTGSGKLDILINNAGIYTTETFEQVTPESYSQVMQTNVEAVFFLTQSLVSVLEAADAPAVVNIGSTLSLRAIPQGSPYNIAKAAIDHLTRSLALELGERGIRVNCVSPGITETEMYRGRYESDEAYHAAITEASGWHPLGRVGKPEDIAEAVWFLASPSASWITGVVLPVDGGLLCG